MQARTCTKVSNAARQSEWLKTTHSDTGKRSHADCPDKEPNSQSNNRWAHEQPEKLPVRFFLLVSPLSLEPRILLCHD